MWKSEQNSYFTSRPIFTILIIAVIYQFLSTFSLKLPAGGASYYARRLSKSRPLEFVKIIVKLHLQAFLQKFENGKMHKFDSCLQDL